MNKRSSSSRFKAHTSNNRLGSVCVISRTASVEFTYWSTDFLHNMNDSFQGYSSNQTNALDLMWGVVFSLVSSNLLQSSDRRFPPHRPRTPAAAEDSCRQVNTAHQNLMMSPFISRVIDRHFIVFFSPVMRAHQLQDIKQTPCLPEQDRGYTSSHTFNKRQLSDSINHI